MKILKEGNTKRIKKCYTCGTKFVYDLLEVEDVGEIFTILGVSCPVCNNFLDVSDFDKKYKERGKKI